MRRFDWRYWLPGCGPIRLRAIPPVERKTLKGLTLDSITPSSVADARVNARRDGVLTSFRQMINILDRTVSLSIDLKRFEARQMRPIFPPRWNFTDPSSCFSGVPCGERATCGCEDAGCGSAGNNRRPRLPSGATLRRPDLSKSG